MAFMQTQWRNNSFNLVIIFLNCGFWIWNTYLIDQSDKYLAFILLNPSKNSAISSDKN